jgi:hypothetical protein
MSLYLINVLKWVDELIKGSFKIKSLLGLII